MALPLLGKKRANKPAKHRTAAAAERGDGLLLREGLGILLLAITTLMVVSLASYHTDDPSWASSGLQREAADLSSPAPPPALHNLAGTVGAHLADGLFGLLGGCAYVVPLLLLLLGVRALRGEPLLMMPVRITGWSLFFIAGPGLMGQGLQSVWTAQDGMILFGRAGGLMGHLLDQILVPYFAPVGSMIVLVTLFLVGLVMGPALTFRGTVATLVAGVSITSQALANRRERRKQPPRNRRKALALTDADEKAAATPDSPEAPAPIAAATPTIVEPTRQAPAPAQETLAFNTDSDDDYQLPSITLLDELPPPADRPSHEELVASSTVLESKLADYGVKGKVTQVHPGPVVTMYEFSPAPGVKVSKIAGLSDDLALAMSATRVRIVAPIPGKSVVGIEIPNRDREMVGFRDMIISGEFSQGSHDMPLALGKDIFGAPVTVDLAAMPHLLVAGSTGSGKSVGLNTMILSLIFRHPPRDVRLAMVDPKMLELSVYEGIPHLIYPVITNPKDAVKLLRRMVIEMLRRYKLMAQLGVRSFKGYNKKVEEADTLKKIDNWREEAIDAGETPLEHGHLPYIVVIVDELADLMAVASKEVEEPIARLAAMARASGIHMVLATQRPSVDVITGLIKSNFPSRIAFQVSSRTDSRTILDGNGAEALLGRGDMLFMGPGTSASRRIHGAFVSDEEVHRVVEFIKGEQAPDYDESLLADVEELAEVSGLSAMSSEEREEGDERDEIYDKAIALVAETGKASASFLQRRLRVGYPRAARLIELMEEDGVVGPAEGSRPRKVLIKADPSDQVI